MTSRPFDTYDGLSVGQLILYAVFLAGAIILCVKHGFSKSAGWRFLLVLALVRIIGCSLRLATISDPTNKSLYIGWMVLTGLGLGPLILMLLGLLSRTFESMRRNGHDIVKPIFHRAIQTLMLVAIILLIVGGFSASFTISSSGSPQISYAEVSRIGSGLMIVVYLLLCGETLLAVVNQGYVVQGEHRIILAVGFCLPFVLVRLVYSLVLVFTHVHSTPWLMLTMEVIMEAIVVLVCQILGFSLSREPEQGTVADIEGQNLPAYGNMSPEPYCGRPEEQYLRQAGGKKTRRERKRERRDRRW